MNTKYIESNTRLGAYAVICGAVLFIIGALLWVVTGTDLDLALVEGDMAGYLMAAEATRSLLVANLSIWILGAFVLTTGANALINLGDHDRAATQMARIAYMAALPIVVISYIAWLALVVQLGGKGSETAVLLAEVTGWFATRADWVATILIIGVGPLFIAYAGRERWVPGWLRGWGFATTIASGFTLLGLFIPSFAGVGFLIIPIGLGWMIAAGIVLMRRMRKRTVEARSLAST
ncbi:MAG: hypothetical protein R3293_25995 [Candidatus Promineifilaceae bacterium]|nr:hypothetical protein [Candidatus Promineifilaceae bacterium]